MKSKEEPNLHEVPALQLNIKVNSKLDPARTVIALHEHYNLNFKVYSGCDLRKLNSRASQVTYKWNIYQKLLTTVIYIMCLIRFS